MHAGICAGGRPQGRSLPQFLNTEGEDHRRLRRLLNPAFSRQVIDALLPRFQRLAAELAGSFAERGRCEFMAEFADPYAARVIAILLGIPEEEWPTIAAESAAVGLAMGVQIREHLPRIEAALATLYDYADALIADRRRGPRHYLVTALVQEQAAGERLTTAELRDSLALLIFGGFDTTRNQLGLAMQVFIDHPAQWRLLGQRPELGPAAVEEVMRVSSTTTWVTREAIEDLTFDGLDITAGTTIHLLCESAGTDPRAFPRAEFDITAAGRPPHFGFGGGIHYCLGHLVARADMNIALAVLARRLQEPAWRAKRCGSPTAATPGRPGCRSPSQGATRFTDPPPAGRPAARLGRRSPQPPGVRQPDGSPPPPSSWPPATRNAANTPRRTDRDPRPRHRATPNTAAAPAPATSPMRHLVSDRAGGAAVQASARRNHSACARPAVLDPSDRQSAPRSHAPNGSGASGSPKARSRSILTLVGPSAGACGWIRFPASASCRVGPVLGWRLWVSRCLLPGLAHGGRGAWPRYAVAGVVDCFDADEGWGVLTAPEVPGGCFVHFSSIQAADHRMLHPGQHVRFTFEELPGLQDGCPFRAQTVWLVD